MEIIQTPAKSLARVNVVGTSGSGKTTFSRRLAQALGCPYVEMDKIFWRPDWQWSTDPEFFGRLKQELSGDAWVVDGNYTRSIPVKWERVQLVVWLDYSFPRTLLRAFRRAVRRAWTREELWPGTGNRESFLRSFCSRDSIIWWTLTTYRGVRRKYLRYMSDPKFKHIQFIRLRSPREAELFLARMRQRQISVPTPVLNSSPHISL